MKGGTIMRYISRLNNLSCPARVPEILSTASSKTKNFPLCGNDIEFIFRPLRRIGGLLKSYKLTLLDKKNIKIRHRNMAD